MIPAAARPSAGGAEALRGGAARRSRIAVAGWALALLLAGRATAQLPVAKPLNIDPKSYGFTQLPVGGSATVDFNVCKPVPDALFGGTLIGQGLTGQIIQATTSGPFAIVAGKSLDLRTKTCETVRIEFKPTSVGAFYAWLLFRVQESPFNPGHRMLFESYALIVGGARRAEGIFFVDASVAQGSGSISGPDIACPPRCHAEYPRGAQITFTAVPGPMVGFSIPTFRSWGGACAGQQRQCTITINGDTTVSATFGAFSPPPRPFIPPVPFTVRIEGRGNVVMSPGAVCEGNNVVCPRSAPAGTPVSLGAIGGVLALPLLVQKPFLGWDGVCQGTSDECDFILDQPGLTAVAKFGPGTTAVRGLVLVALDGLGSVTASGISCPGDCNERYQPFTSLTLTAHPASGWRFGNGTGNWGWGGACVGQGNPCTISVETTNLVEAHFTTAPGWQAPPGVPGTANLNVQVSHGGTASGTGIECPPTCIADLPIGSTATLVAQAHSPYRFVGWTGACGGLAEVCLVPMTQDRRATALFALPEYKLDVAVSGGGRLSVGDQPSLRGCCSHHQGVCGCGGDYVVCCDATFSPTCSCTQINCPGDCTETYPAGTSVTIKAVANSGWRFSSWTGACAGQGNPCTLTMVSDWATTAIFAR